LAIIDAINKISESIEYKKYKSSATATATDSFVQVDNIKSNIKNTNTNATLIDITNNDYTNNTKNNIDNNETSASSTFNSIEYYGVFKEAIKQYGSKAQCDLMQHNIEDGYALLSFGTTVHTTMWCVDAMKTCNVDEQYPNKGILLLLRHKM
jgi:hypothetical protein